jgi:hypothetical protein
MPKTITEELEKAVKEVLEGAPKVREYSLRELEKNAERIPWPTERWHFEYVRTPREPNEKIGEAYKKLEALYKKSKKKSKTS